MLTLSKLAYLECHESQRYWYDTFPRNVIKFDIKLCCEILRLYLRGEVQIVPERNYELCFIAASFGHLDCLEFSRKLGFKWDKYVCKIAARNGDLDVLKHAHENGCPWDESTCFTASKFGNLECLKYAHQNKCPWDERTYLTSINETYIDCLSFDHKNKCSRDGENCQWVASSREMQCLIYARNNGCPENFLTLLNPEDNYNVEGVDEYPYQCYF